jgi:hypothetical protein
MIPTIILSQAYKLGGKGNPDWFDTDVGPMKRLDICKACDLYKSTFTNRLEGLKNEEDLINNPDILRPANQDKATRFKVPGFVYKARVYVKKLKKMKPVKKALTSGYSAPGSVEEKFLRQESRKLDSARRNLAERDRKYNELRRVALERGGIQSRVW